MDQIKKDVVSDKVIIHAIFTRPETEAKNTFTSLQKGLDELVQQGLLNSHAARSFRLKRAQALKNIGVENMSKSNGELITIQKARGIVKNNQLIEKGKWTDITKIVLASLPNDKYISVKYLIQFVMDSLPNQRKATLEGRFLSSMSHLMRQDQVTRVKLNEIPFRAISDRTISYAYCRQGLEKDLEKIGLLTEEITEQIKHYWLNQLIKTVLDSATDEQRLQLNFVTEEEADSNLINFAENHICGPVTITGSGQTQSVFRLNANGLSKTKILLHQLSLNK